MREARARLLIVDDEPSIRSSMSLLLSEIGYRVRSASDGDSALAEIRREAPEVLLSDLNMPGMSGFELLPVVRLKFPQVRVVAMSGAFSGREVPAGVSADAFYPKGGSIVYLLGILESLTPAGHAPPRHRVAPEPLWIARNEHNAGGEACVTVECPECMITVPQVISGTSDPFNKTTCALCGASIRFAILRPEDPVSLLPSHSHSSPTAARRVMQDYFLKMTR